MLESHRVNNWVRKFDVDIPHRHDATGIVEALFDVDIRDRTIPGQVNFSGRKRLDERVIVGIQDPVEFNALVVKMRLQAFKHGDGVPGAIAVMPSMT
jgi:hypothetical protein